MDGRQQTLEKTVLVLLLGTKSRCALNRQVVGRLPFHPLPVAVWGPPLSRPIESQDTCAFTAGNNTNNASSAHCMPIVVLKQLFKGLCHCYTVEAFNCDEFLTMRAQTNFLTFNITCHYLVTDKLERWKGYRMDTEDAITNSLYIT